MLILITLSQANFFDSLYFRQKQWLPQNDLRHYQIWNTLTDENLKKGKVVVTDRLGEPIYYFLAYESFDPSSYLEDRKLGIVTPSGIQRVEGVANLEFRAFKYYEDARGSDEIWIGMAGEFVGENRNYSQINDVYDGVIYKKIKEVKQVNKFIGSELWFVKTTL